VAVDLGQLVVRQLEIAERGDVLLELLDARGANQREGHAQIAERPRERWARVWPRRAASSGVADRDNRAPVLRQ
jgi:hypothetical protein